MDIYKITNLINGKIYIGQEKKYKDKYLGSGIHIKRAVKKYGKENFKKEIIEYCISIEELNEKEKYWINLLNSKEPNGYNIIDGGIGGPNFRGHKHSDESKKKMSISRKGQKRSEAFKRHLSEIRKGITRSQETKDKLSKAFKGKTFVDKFGKEKAEDIIRRTAIKNTGKKRNNDFREWAKNRLIGNKYGELQSIETREKKRILFSGDKNPGKNKTKETIDKISRSKIGKTNQLHSMETREKMSKKAKEIWIKRKCQKIE